MVVAVSSGSRRWALRAQFMMIHNLEEAIDHPDMTEELAEILSTDTARLTYEVTTDVAIGNADSE